MILEGKIIELIDEATFAGNFLEGGKGSAILAIIAICEWDTEKYVFTCDHSDTVRAFCCEEKEDDIVILTQVTGEENFLALMKRLEMEELICRYTAQY